MIDGAAPVLLTFAFLIVWSVHLTKLASGRLRSAHGAASKFRYSLPALVAWCWPLVIAAEFPVKNLSLALSCLLPFSAPLIGQTLADHDRPPPDGIAKRPRH